MICLPITTAAFAALIARHHDMPCCQFCRSDRAVALEDLGHLLAALEVPLLSRTVQQSVPQLQGFSGSSQLDPIVADCVLAVQRYLLQRRPEAYHALDETVASRLLNLRYACI